jgi:nitrous oxide reductase accessory protein NosL
MNSLKKPVCLLILLAWGAILAGCTSKTAKDTSIPWSRPADWEGTVPGMGSGGR